MDALDFYIVDVFTTVKYGGNQLGVFVDFNDTLSDDEMLQITRELKFPETTFIKKQLDDFKFEVRIFTPEYEVPFAGHPTLGTSYVISKYILSQPSRQLTLKLKHANIDVSIDNPNDLENSKFIMQQAQPEFLGNFSPVEIATALDIDLSNLDPSKPIEEVSTGLPYIIIPVKTLQQINHVNIGYQSLSDFLISNKKHKSNSPNNLNTSLFFVCEDTFEKSSGYNTRMFCLENGAVVEDAATGSANGCLLAYLLKNENKKIDGIVEQGFQKGRKSYIHLDGKLENTNYILNIGGNVVEVSNGKWNV